MTYFLTMIHTYILAQCVSNMTVLLFFLATSFKFL